MVPPPFSDRFATPFAALVVGVAAAFFLGTAELSHADEIEPEPSSDAPVAEKAPTKDQPAPIPPKQAKQPAGHVHEAPPPPPRSAKEIVTDIWTREKLTGDWRGLRTDLAEHGVDIEVTFSQYGQGVASGGVETNGEYGGKFDYRLNADLTKLAGFWDGLSVNLHAETRWGNDILADAGAFALPNGPLMFPLPGDYSDSDITGLLVEQFLFDDRLQILAGKLQAFDMITGLFPNVVDFGLKGFLNANSFMSILPWGRWLNLSQFGTAVWTLKDQLPTTGVMVVGQMNTTDNWKFKDSFEDGVGLMVFHRFTWKILDKPGYLYLAPGMSTKHYNSLDPHDWIVIPGVGPVDNKKKLPWSVAAYLYQVFWQAEGDEKRFAEFFVGGSLADKNPSFARWDVFAQVQAWGPIACRPHDRMGVSGWYNALTKDFKSLTSDKGLRLRDTWGFELYYNVEINKWLHLTPDLQLVKNQNKGDNLAIIPGVRLVIDF